jgi:hypothetical protein
MQETLGKLISGATKSVPADEISPRLRTFYAPERTQPSVEHLTTEVAVTMRRVIQRSASEATKSGIENLRNIADRFKVRGRVAA